MSTPADDRPPAGSEEAPAPSVSTAPATDPGHRWWSAIPHHLGRARTSTVALSALFVAINVVGAADAANGTVEDVTLRVTRVRSPNGEVVTVPNGQIVKVVNLSRDWARAVVDVPVPTSVDVNRVNEILRDVGREAFRDPAMRPLLLDPPTVMGVESLGLDEVNVRVVARTLPGKQFEVGRDLRARVVFAFRAQGMQVSQSPVQQFSDDGATVVQDAVR